MICRYCGMETGLPRHHVTQRECVESLERQVEKLEREVTPYLEVAFHRQSNLYDFYHDRMERLEELKDRMERMERVADAVRKAMRRGTRKAWEDLMKTLETAFPGDPEASRGP